MKKLFFLVALSGALSLSLFAQSKKSADGPTYVYGVVQCFADTVCYMTSVQQLDASAMTAAGLLKDRAAYSAVLSNFVAQRYGQPLCFAAIYFGKSRKRVEHEYLRNRSRYMNRKDMLLHEMPESEFRFETIRYDYDQ